MSINEGYLKIMALLLKSNNIKPYAGKHFLYQKKQGFHQFLNTPA